MLARLPFESMVLKAETSARERGGGCLLATEHSIKHKFEHENDQNNENKKTNTHVDRHQSLTNTTSTNTNK